MRAFSILIKVDRGNFGKFYLGFYVDYLFRLCVQFL